MEPVRARSTNSGLPLLPLLIAVPVVLAAGFVTGMGIATYGGRPLAILSSPHEAAAPAQGAAPGQDLSWMITPATGTTTNRPPNAATTTPDTTPVTSVQAPARVYFTGTAHDAHEARLALDTDYSVYQSDAGTLTVDYQPMHQSASSGVSIVGMISADSYATWVRILQTEPDKLNAWLSAAANRVQPAAVKDPFHLSWAVVDVLRDRPTGFAETEITPLENRTYLVIRPLAATVDHTKTQVSIRPLDSLAQAPQAGAAGATSPWAAYGPVLHFDATDPYQPPRAVGTKPLAPGDHL